MAIKVLTVNFNSKANIYILAYKGWSICESLVLGGQIYRCMPLGDQNEVQIRRKTTSNRHGCWKFLCLSSRQWMKKTVFFCCSVCSVWQLLPVSWKAVALLLVHGTYFPSSLEQGLKMEQPNIHHSYPESPLSWNFVPILSHILRYTSIHTADYDIQHITSSCQNKRFLQHG